MTIEKFLSFWSQHNVVIIESLVVLVILFSLFLAFRSFFAKKGRGDTDDGVSEGAGLDAAQLEKTLQKILENQAKSGAAPSSSAGLESALADMDLSMAAGAGASAEVVAEAAQLRTSLSESNKKVEALQLQLAEAMQKVTQAESAASAAPAADAGMSAQEKEDLTGKIRDLEARLAEYEIISEDIADLSRFREENDQLKKELASVKGGAAPASAPAAPPASEPPPAAAADASAESANLIDEDLMKEFAAAVEGQKAASAAEKAGAGAEAPKADDTDQLMNEFENFVAKKS